MTDKEFWSYMHEALNMYIANSDLSYHLCYELVKKFEKVKSDTYEETE